MLGPGLGRYDLGRILVWACSVTRRQQRGDIGDATENVSRTRGAQPGSRVRPGQDPSHDAGARTPTAIHARAGAVDNGHFRDSRGASLKHRCQHQVRCRKPSRNVLGAERDVDTRPEPGSVKNRVRDPTWQTREHGNPAARLPKLIQHLDCPRHRLNRDAAERVAYCAVKSQLGCLRPSLVVGKQRPEDIARRLPARLMNLRHPARERAGPADHSLRRDGLGKQRSIRPSSGTTVPIRPQQASVMPGLSVAPFIRRTDARVSHQPSSPRSTGQAQPGPPGPSATGRMR